MDPATNPYKNEWWEKNKKTLMQVACSGDLSDRLVSLKSIQGEIAKLSDEYTAYTEGELFLTNEYYQLQMNNIEKEFFQKQREYWSHHVNLQLIYFFPVYLN